MEQHWARRGPTLSTVSFGDASEAPELERVRCDSKRIITANHNKGIDIFDSNTGQYSNTIMGWEWHRDWVWDFAFDDQHLISASCDTTLALWDMPNEGDPVSKPKMTYGGHRGWVQCVKFHHNMIVSGSGDNTIKVWDIGRNECVQTLVGHTGFVYTLQLMQDGRTVVSGSGGDDNSVRVWDLRETGACKRSIRGHRATVMALAMDGDHLLTGSYDCSAKLWDIRRLVDSGVSACVRSFIGHVGGVGTVALSANKRVAVTGSHDATVKLWDPVGPPEATPALTTLTAHSSVVVSVDIQPEAPIITTCGMDLCKKTWDFTSEMDQARAGSNMPMSVSGVMHPVSVEG